MIHMEKPRVAVIGSGSIGLLLYAYLKLANWPALLVTNRPEQADHLNKEGLTFVAKSGEHQPISVTATPLSSFYAEEAEVGFITVKSFAVKALLPQLQRKKWDGLVFFQNGMTHLEILRQIPARAICCGIVEIGAKRESDVRVQHTGDGTIWIGDMVGDSKNFDPMWACLHNVGLKAQKVTNWRDKMERKLIANAAINPLTGLFRVKNGALIENQLFSLLLKELVKEACVTLGREREVDEHLAYTRAICDKTANNLSSMYMDLTHHRRTEIESITGYLIKEAAKKGIEIPNTSFVYHAVMGMDEEGRKVRMG
ncbi:2-dehydropantoate 2-reductase [Halalkalibacterium halodurans]|nr:2-dehydropantoate 2-reductase [Halalkalibacterium halodurans]